MHRCPGHALFRAPPQSTLPHSTRVDVAESQALGLIHILQ